MLLKLRILDSNDEILGESGLIKPDEYIVGVSLSQDLSTSVPIRLLIMAYQPESYHNAGNVALATEIIVKLEGYILAFLIKQILYKLYFEGGFFLLRTT